MFNPGKIGKGCEWRFSNLWYWMRMAIPKLAVLDENGDVVNRDKTLQEMWYRF